jgi:hypothetical protein
MYTTRFIYAQIRKIGKPNNVKMLEALIYFIHTFFGNYQQHYSYLT